MENTFEEDYPEYCKEKEPQKPIWIQKYCVWIDGHICDDLHYSVNTNDMDKIGNLFDTKEEAEKAVEKLKAWKRLKDAGIYFVYDVIKEGSEHNFILRPKCKKEKIMKPFAECESLFRDLKIIFGGEE